ncbi:MAG: VWA domain-containing protein, partial [Terriglobales bacterium]
MASHLALICIALCLVWLIPPALPAQQAASPQTAKPPAAKPAAQAAKPPQILTFHSNAFIVQVNFTARDAKGNIVNDLKPSEVVLTENGRRQSIEQLEFENVDAEPGNAAAGAAAESGSAVTIEKGSGKPVAPSTPKPTALAPAPAVSAAESQYRDRRLMVMYFDLTTMQPEEVQNVMQQAVDYVHQKMQPADLVAIATLGNTLQVNQEFTDNKAVLVRALNGLNPALASGFADGATGTSDGTADDGSSFTADDTEFNIANADFSLEALQSVCDMLSPIQQKKSILYFTSGIQRSGVDNEITVRSATNSCVKANASVYSVDARGLQANPPGGNATGGSIRGASAFNGGAQANTLNSTYA